MFAKQVIYNETDSDNQSEPQSQSSQNSSPGINRFVAYRNDELRMKKLVQKCFNYWKQQTLANYRQNIIMADQFYNQKLFEKGFDGLLQYATLSSSFHQKILVIFYKVLLRSGWQRIKIIKRLTQQKQIQNNNQMLDSQEKIKISQSLSSQKSNSVNCINQKSQAGSKRNDNNQHSKPNFYQSSYGPLKYNDQEYVPSNLISLDFSRKSSRRKIDKSYYDNRKYAPITEVIEIPNIIINRQKTINDVQKEQTIGLQRNNYSSQVVKQEQKSKRLNLKENIMRFIKKQNKISLKIVDEIDRQKQLTKQLDEQFKKYKKMIQNTQCIVQKFKH